MPHPKTPRVFNSLKGADFTLGAGDLHDRQQSRSKSPLPSREATGPEAETTGLSSTGTADSLLARRGRLLTPEIQIADHDDGKPNHKLLSGNGHAYDDEHCSYPRLEVELSTRLRMIEERLNYIVSQVATLIAASPKRGKKGRVSRTNANFNDTYEKALRESLRQNVAHTESVTSNSSHIGDKQDIAGFAGPCHMASPSGYISEGSLGMSYLSPLGSAGSHLSHLSPCGDMNTRGSILEAPRASGLMGSSSELHVKENDYTSERNKVTMRHWASAPSGRTCESMDRQHHMRQTDIMREHIREQIQNERGRGPWSVLVWRFLESPNSSILAQTYSSFVQTFVIISVLLSCLQTVNDSSTYLRGPVIQVLQISCESIYAAEWCVRLIVCPDRWLFWQSMFNWIDLISALPLVVRLTVDQDTYNGGHAAEHWAHSVVVAVPLVRLLKLIRRFEKFHLLLSAWKLACEALPVLLYTLMLIALFFSVAVYFIEPESNIGSLPKAIWFIVVTMTTVGYGDVTPDTAGGHIVVTMLIIISSLYMAIPIGIVGTAFSEVWGNRDRLLLMHRMRDAFLQEGYSAESLVKLVSLFDGDGDGELAIDEFGNMLKQMHINVGEERVLMLHESIDKDGGGTINIDELISSLFPVEYSRFWRVMADTMGSATTGVYDSAKSMTNKVATVAGGAAGLIRQSTATNLTNLEKSNSLKSDLKGSGKNADTPTSKQPSLASSVPLDHTTSTIVETSGTALPSSD